MRHSRIQIAIALTLLAVIATASGCGSSAATRFYQLSTTPGDGAPAASTASTPALGIGPISLPAYLDRDQVVVREDANGLELMEFNQWAEPLQDSFVRVFSENLAARVGTDRIALHPWGSTTVDFRVEVRVIRFECDESGKCTLAARWVVHGKHVERASRHEEQATGDSVAEMVAAMSRALGALSDEVAAAIKAPAEK